MKTSDFKDGMSGKLTKIPEGVYAFIPEPLPPKKLQPSWELMAVNSEADRALTPHREVNTNPLYQIEQRLQYEITD